MKKMMLAVLSVFMLCGCFNQGTGAYIQKTEKTLDNDVAQSFVLKNSTYLSKFKLDYVNGDIKQVEINHYKGGEKIDRFFLFMRVEDTEVADLQYIYGSYLLENNDFEFSIYMYGPENKEMKWKEYSYGFTKDQYELEYNNTSYLSDIYSVNGKYYTHALIIDGECNSIKDLLESDLEYIVMEIE